VLKIGGVVRDVNLFPPEPYVAGLNELADVLTGITLAVRRGEALDSERLSALAEEIKDAARRHDLYEPLAERNS
jgi:hypothetical protein